jgi:RNA polymerase sigma-70 factor (ECF subfamily)
MSIRAVTPEVSSGGGVADLSAEQLLERVAVGDEGAFAALYDLFAGRILGMVTRVLRSHAQSEEVTQEVLVEIWRKAGQFSSQRGTALSWALTIAHRRAIDRVRSEQSSIDREERADRLDLQRPFDEVAEITMEAFERDEVRRALDALTELQRESILLAYYKGYTSREIAEMLKIPVGTVKTRMRDGLIRLRDALSERT